MIDSQQSDSSGPGEQPGKTRTWWHPLLVRLLRYELDSAYSVSEEVPVGKMPLRVDILLVRREEGALSEAAQRDLSALVPLLNRYTLIEFKAPPDALERGDMAHLAGCSYLWHSQEIAAVLHNEVSLIVLAPVLNAAAREEMRRLGWEPIEEGPGTFRVSGSPFMTWLIETDVAGARGQPVLSLVSRVFLKDRQRIIEELARTGHLGLVHYMLQQVQQFRAAGEAFAMQHRYSDNLVDVEEDILSDVLESVPEGILTNVLESVPDETLTKVLESVPAERRLRGLPPEERLRGLSPEQLASGLSEEQAAELRKLLERQRPR
jgi:hypothetical protein